MLMAAHSGRFIYTNIHHQVPGRWFVKLPKGKDTFQRVLKNKNRDWRHGPVVCQSTPTDAPRIRRVDARTTLMINRKWTDDLEVHAREHYSLLLDQVGYLAVGWWHQRSYDIDTVTMVHATIQAWVAKPSKQVHTCWQKNQYDSRMRIGHHSEWIRRSATLFLLIINLILFIITTMDMSLVPRTSGSSYPSCLLLDMPPELFSIVIDYLTSEETYALYLTNNHSMQSRMTSQIKRVELDHMACKSLMEHACQTPVQMMLTLTSVRQFTWRYHQSDPSALIWRMMGQWSQLSHLTMWHHNFKSHFNSVDLSLPIRCRLPNTITHFFYRGPRYLEIWVKAVLSNSPRLQSVDCSVSQLDNPFLLSCPSVNVSSMSDQRGCSALSSSSSLPSHQGSLHTLIIAKLNPTTPLQSGIVWPMHLTNIQLMMCDRLTNADFEHLPLGLQTLRLGLSSNLDSYLFAKFPRTLTNLSIKFMHKTILIDHLKDLPTSLEALTLYRVKIHHHDMSGNDPVISVDRREILSNLPRQLKRLTLIDNNVYVDRDLACLPPKLEYLETGYDNFHISSHGFYDLPRTLTSLITIDPMHLVHNEYPRIMNADHVTHLPPRLTTIIIDKCTPLTREAIRSLPRSITHLSIGSKLLTMGDWVMLPKVLKILRVNQDSPIVNFCRDMNTKYNDRVRHRPQDHHAHSDWIFMSMQLPHLQEINHWYVNDTRKQLETNDAYNNVLVS